MYLYMHFTHYTLSLSLSLSLSHTHTHTHRPCERATLAPLSRASTVHSLRYCTHLLSDPGTVLERGVIESTKSRECVIESTKSRSLYVEVFPLHFRTRAGGGEGQSEEVGEEGDMRRVLVTGGATAESECGNTERQREKVCVCVCLCAGFSRVFGWVSHAHLARRTAATLAGSYRCSSLRCPGTMARSICEGGTGTAGNSRSADFASARRSHGLDREAPRRLCAHGATCTLAPAPMREVAPVTSGGGGI